MIEHSTIKGKLVCVALNDQQQLDNLTKTFSEAPYNKVPNEPVLYFKPRNTWAGDKATMAALPVGENYVVGASLAVVIGKECCRVKAADALSYVGSYGILHDISLPEETYYRPDIKGKCLDASAPLSTQTVPVSAIADPNTLSVVTAVNGEVKATFPLSRLHRDVSAVIEKISYIMTLDKGDVIGVGFIGERVGVAGGDEIVSSIKGVGTLTTIIGGAK